MYFWLLLQTYPSDLSFCVPGSHIFTHLFYIEGQFNVTKVNHYLSPYNNAVLYDLECAEYFYCAFQLLENIFFYDE